MQIAAAEKEKSVENVFNTERAKLGSLETNGAGDLRGARRPLGAQVCHLVRKSSGHSCRDFDTYGENPWKGVATSTRAREGGARVHFGGGEERRGRQMRRGFSSFGRNSTFSFSAKAKEGEEDATATKRTPFEPWAQKLAHWSPGYCINAAGTEVIFAPKCNEGGERERARARD